MGVSVAGIVLLSAKVATVATLVAIVPAFAVAWVLARKQFVGSGLLQSLVTMPLVLPPVVTGYGLLLLFGTKGPIGGLLSDYLGITVAFRWTGAALAAGVMAFPLLVRPIGLSIQSIDRGLEEAASTLGAGRATVFFTVTLPLCVPGIIAGAVMGFAKALGEFGATITFVSNIPGETQTLSLAIYAFLQTPTGDRAAFALICISVVIALSAVFVSEWLARRMQKRLGNEPA